jgi:hypothetical protein
VTLRITPSRYRRNIANDLAHELLDALDPSHPAGCDASATRDAVRVTLILDRLWEAEETVVEGRMPFTHTISGFATVLVASTREWKHRQRPTFVRTRLPLGWQPEDLARSVFEGMDEIREAEVLAAWRERVLDEMHAREIDEPLPERLEDHPTRFEEMTLEDCRFWLEWLGRLPRQTFAYRAPLPWRPGPGRSG